MSGKLKYLCVLALIVTLSGVGASLHAQVPAKFGVAGPVTGPHGFPAWYQDQGGLKLELCVDQADPKCAAFPPDPLNFPESGFGDEGFWWSADAIATGPAGDALLVLGMEAAYGGVGVAQNGKQIVFGRIRIRVDVPSAGTYTVQHPYGEKTFVVTEFDFADKGGKRAINYTEDIGALDPLLGRAVDPTLPESPTNLEDTGLIQRNFEGALASPLMEKLLVWSTFNADPALNDPLLQDALTGAQYVGDGATPHAVTGSPLGQDRNYFRVTGPGGVIVYETNLFTVIGKVDTGKPIVAHDYPPVPAQVLQNVGPLHTAVLPPGQTVNTSGYPVGFPIFYEDFGTPDPIDVSDPPPVGLRLTICPSSDPMCISAVPNPLDPNALKLGVGEEAFFWAADARIQQDEVDARLILALEAAFAGDGAVQDGNQNVFTRVRIRADVPAPGTYIVTHPYGTKTFENVTVADGINYTEDIAGFNPFQFDPEFQALEPTSMFDRALYGNLGPSLLTWPSYNDPVLNPGLLVDGIQYIGDPGVPHEVVGSPMDPPTNFFRIQGPEGSGIDFETNLFSVQGKVYSPDTYLVVAPPNAPIANNDQYSLDMNSTGAIPILANDTTFDGIPLTAVDSIIIGSEGPLNGQAVVTGNTVTYTPRQNYFGTDTFSYSITVGGITSLPATVSVTVNAATQQLVAKTAKVKVKGRRVGARGPKWNIKGSNAVPGAQITIQAGDVVIATVQANRRGRWHFVGRAIPGLTNPTSITVLSPGAPTLTIPLTVR